MDIYFISVCLELIVLFECIVCKILISKYL